jgi:hypothetical protein
VDFVSSLASAAALSPVTGSLVTRLAKRPSPVGTASLWLMLSLDDVVLVGRMLSWIVFCSLVAKFWPRRDVGESFLTLSVEIYFLEASCFNVSALLVDL